jgi:predicted PurR-regulated permease PerM
MTQEQTFSLTFILIFVSLLVLLGLVFAPFLPTIFWATILARLMYPLYQNILRLFSGREGLAAGVSTVVVMLVVVAPFLYLFILGVQQSIDAYQQVAAWVDRGGLKSAGESLSKLPGINRISQHVIGRLVVAHGQVELSFLEATKWLTDYLTIQAAGIATNVILVVTNTLVLLFTLFFLFRDGARLYGRLYDAIPLEATHKARIMAHLNRTVSGVVRGSLISALAQGLVAGLAYATLAVPFPVFLGALTALLALVPFGGTALVWGPIAVWLLATGAWLKALILVAIGGTLIALIDNIVYSWLAGARARLPVIFLFFASLGGLAWFGFLGLFVGPLLLAAVIAAFKIYEEDYRASACTPVIKQE